MRGRDQGAFKPGPHDLLAPKGNGAIRGPYVSAAGAENTQELLSVARDADRARFHGVTAKCSCRFVANKPSPVLLNAAVWRHHIDGCGGYRADSGRGEFDRRVVDIEIQNRRVLIVVFALVVVHWLPRFNRRLSFAQAKELLDAYCPIVCPNGPPLLSVWRMADAYHRS